MEKCGCERCRTKKRDERELRLLQNRLARIEGQVRGVRAMVDSDAYCVDILTQVSAIRSALTAFSKELLSTHIKECVANDIKNDNFATVDELCDVVEKFMR